MVAVPAVWIAAAALAPRALAAYVIEEEAEIERAGCNRSFCRTLRQHPTGRDKKGREECFWCGL